MIRTVNCAIRILTSTSHIKSSLIYQRGSTDCVIQSDLLCMLCIRQSVLCQWICTYISVLCGKIDAAGCITDGTGRCSQFGGKCNRLYGFSGFLIQAVQTAGTAAGVQICFTGINTAAVITAAVILPPDWCLILILLIHIFICCVQADKIAICKSCIQISGIISECSRCISSDDIRIKPQRFQIFCTECLNSSVHQRNKNHTVRIQRFCKSTVAFAPHLYGLHGLPGVPVQIIQILSLETADVLLDQDTIADAVGIIPVCTILFFPFYFCTGKRFRCLGFQDVLIVLRLPVAAPFCVQLFLLTV